METIEIVIPLFKTGENINFPIRLAKLKVVRMGIPAWVKLFSIAQNVNFETLGRMSLSLVEGCCLSGVGRLHIQIQD